MDHFLEYLVPVVSVFLSYLCGRLQAFSTQRQTAAKERYEAFYVPFVSLLYAGRMDLLAYSQLSPESRAKFFDLVFHNIQHIDEQTQTLLPEFYTASLNMLEFESGAQGYENAPTSLDSVFSKLTDSVLLESAKLSRALRLPQIGKAFSTASCRRG